MRADRTPQGVLVEIQGETYRYYCNVCGKVSKRIYKNPKNASAGADDHRSHSSACREGNTPREAWLGIDVS